MVVESVVIGGDGAQNRHIDLAHPGAVTVIGRCSGDMGLNIHLHTLADGVFMQDQKDKPVSFHALPAPTAGEVAGVAWETCRRTLDLLARRGYWEEDQGGLAEDEAVPHPLAGIYSASVRGVLLVDGGENPHSLAGLDDPVHRSYAHASMVRLPPGRPPSPASETVITYIEA